MPKRKFRERRQEDSEEEQQELENVLAEVAIPERTRTKGVSVSAAHEDGYEKTVTVNNGIKYYEDVMEKRLQEFVEVNLEKQFDKSFADLATNPDYCDKIAYHEQELEHSPQHLLTPAVAEVSVPGFNTAITKVSLNSQEPNAPATAKADKGRSSLEKPRSAPWVPRDLFPKRFGKSKEAIPKRLRPE